MKPVRKYSKQTFLCFGVGLYLQDDRSNCIRIHVIQRVGNPLWGHKDGIYKVMESLGNVSTGLKQFIILELLLTSRVTMPASCSSVMFLKTLSVVFSVDSTSSTSPKTQECTHKHMQKPNSQQLFNNGRHLCCVVSLTSNISSLLVWLHLTCRDAARCLKQQQN